MEACDSSKQKIETCSIDESLISGQKRTLSIQRSPGLRFSCCLAVADFNMGFLAMDSSFSIFSFPMLSFVLCLSHFLAPSVSLSYISVK